MMQTHPVPKDLMFKLRLDAEDRKRLEAVAQHYSAPAATVIRILVKEKFDAIRRESLETTPTTKPRRR
jgi:predicted DNA-binding protein